MVDKKILFLGPPIVYKKNCLGIVIKRQWKFVPSMINLHNNWIFVGRIIKIEIKAISEMEKEIVLKA